MSSPIEKATAHFRSKISGEMSAINVEEWGLKIYYKPSATLKEQAQIIEYSQKGATVEALVETLIQRARNEDGTKMFSKADKQVFMNEVDPEVIIDVVSRINGVDENLDVDEAGKN